MEYTTDIGNSEDTLFSIYMLSRNNEFDCSKAEKELCFHCRLFTESICDTVSSLRYAASIIPYAFFLN